MGKILSSPNLWNETNTPIYIMYNYQKHYDSKEISYAFDTYFHSILITDRVPDLTTFPGITYRMLSSITFNKSSYQPVSDCLPCPTPPWRTLHSTSIVWFVFTFMPTAAFPLSARPPSLLLSTRGTCKTPRNFVQWTHPFLQTHKEHCQEPANWLSHDRQIRWWFTAGFS